MFLKLTLFSIVGRVESVFFIRVKLGDKMQERKKSGKRNINITNCWLLSYG